MKVHQAVALHVSTVKRQRARLAGGRRRGDEHGEPKVLLEHAREPRRERVGHRVLRGRLARVRLENQALAPPGNALLQVSNELGGERADEELRGSLRAGVLVKDEIHRGRIDDCEPQYGALWKADDHRCVAKRPVGRVGVAQHLGVLDCDEGLALAIRQLVGLVNRQLSYLSAHEHGVRRWVGVGVQQTLEQLLSRRRRAAILEQPRRKAELRRRI